MRRAVYGVLKEQYPDVTMAYGYITKNIRISLGLGKSHVSDACCIAGSHNAKPLETVLRQKKVRRNSRQMYKANTLKGGVRKRSQAPHMVQGFRLFDRVQFRGSVMFVTGRRTSGYFTLLTLDGTKVHDSAKAAELILLEMRQGYTQERRTGQFLPALQKTGSLAEE